MSTDFKCAQFDFLALDYQTKRPKLKVLKKRGEELKGALPGSYGKVDEEKGFILRWHMSILGECAPVISPTTGSNSAAESPIVYRYDWAFGITCVEGYYWDWQAALCAESALVIQVVLQPLGDKVEAVPVSALLSALHPSRNTKGFFETMGPKMAKAAGEMADTGAATLPFLKYASTALMFGSNVLESRTNDQRNWFL
jgi:hypothetical protein